jgi:hypothetical protein
MGLATMALLQRLGGGVAAERAKGAAGEDVAPVIPEFAQRNIRDPTQQHLWGPHLPSPAISC